VVSAIANQTQILKSCIDRVKAGGLLNGEDLQCSQALKWVVHFLGDIAQPLHASGRKAGGNGIEVVFGNKTTELHAVSSALPSFSITPLQIFADAKLHIRFGTATSPTPTRTSQASPMQPSTLSSRISSPVSMSTTLNSPLRNGWPAPIPPEL